MAATEAPDVLAATGDVLVDGALVATENADVFASAGLVLVQGALVLVEGLDTFAATGTVSQPPGSHRNQGRRRHMTVWVG